MKLLLSRLAILLCPLLLIDLARCEDTAGATSPSEAVPEEQNVARAAAQPDLARPARKADGGAASRAPQDAGVEPEEPASPAFSAKIITGDRTREFDSPARALGELQRAAGLRRRSGKEDFLPFAAVLTVNGVEYEFSDADEARTACRAVLEGLRRLAKVRAALGDLGTIPEIDPVAPAAPADAAVSTDPSGDAGGKGQPRESTAHTVRQRVNEALRHELQRNQGGLLSQQRIQQIEIEAVRELLSRALSTASAAGESPAAVVPVAGER
jgi:hypothetical protein